MRLFFALQPDASARRLLASFADAVSSVTGGRPPRAENLHVTVAFLGEVPNDQLDQVKAIGKHAAQCAAPFRLTLDRVGMFRQPGIAWIAPADKPDDLVRLFETLRVDRREFHPHITLARHCKRKLEGVTAPRIEWRVEALALMASQTLPDGARYTETASWSLCGSAEK